MYINIKIKKDNIKTKQKEKQIPAEVSLRSWSCVHEAVTFVEVIYLVLTRMPVGDSGFFGCVPCDTCDVCGALLLPFVC